ncbi:hypothetical protein PI124_g8804 [Phytophthora idaei]|nr:hypothetical protein PI126_g15584 [Phytophthora idaei]KAG3246487.1 hypothetical protein PI124_g8804 [Phytophthora idaei]
MFFFCMEPGHRMAQYRKRSGQRGPPRRPQRQQQSYLRQGDARVSRSNGVGTATANHRVHAYEEKGPDTKTKLFEHLTINAAVLGGRATEEDVSRSHQLLDKKCKVSNQSGEVLLDSGTDHNVLRKILATDVFRRKKAVAEPFDGSTTAPQWINEVKADMLLDGVRAHRYVAGF